MTNTTFDEPTRRNGAHTKDMPMERVKQTVSALLAHASEFRLMNPRQLRHDATLTRKVNMAHVRAIAGDWTIYELGVLIASRRANGDYVILDGVHRWMAALSLELSELPCLVFSDLSRAEEKQAVRGLAKRQQESALHLYQLAVGAGDPHFVAMDAIVRASGMEVRKADTRPNARGGGAIRCANEIDRVHSNWNTLQPTMRTMYALDQVSSHWVQARVVQGVGFFWLAWPHAQQARLVDVMARHDPRLFSAQVTQSRHSSGVDATARAAACVLADWYNVRLRKGNLDIDDAVKALAVLRGAAARKWRNARKDADQ